MAGKNFAPNAYFHPLASGSFVNTTAGGTGTPLFAGAHEYHTAIFLGTFGNVGTITVYGHTASTGDGTAVLGSIVSGSGNGGAVAYELATESLLKLGSTYAYLSAQVSVPAGGTWGGALGIISTQPRTSGGTTIAANNLQAFGTNY